jgi:glycosyltransferase involved in cell wall biosynthesis/GT2 family glycosyltransferase
MNTGSPTFSLVINTIDRAGPLQTLLRTLEHQSYPHFEVIVVVGPTRDDTLHMLSEYGKRVQVLRCPTANLGRSRNVGLMAARGDVVAFIDDDAVPCQRWLEQLARLFHNPKLDATGGIVYQIYPDQPMVQHRIGIMSSLSEQVDVRRSWFDCIVPPGRGSQWVGRMMGTNMAYRRQTLLEVGGFDEFFEWVFDDADIALRLAQAGKCIHPVKEAAVYHAPGSSRRRVAHHSHDVKWWVHTKAAAYMAVKAGRVAGEPWPEIRARCLGLVRAHWQWSRELWQDGDFTFRQFARMRAGEVIGGLVGTVWGLFLPRKLARRTQVGTPEAEPAPIRPFLNKQSSLQPAVDPIEGHRAEITLSEPALRICLLSNAYPPNSYEGVGRLTHLMARGLLECGHTVHVVTQGEEDQLCFRDSAYVHQIRCEPARYGRYELFPDLHHSLNYSHAVHEKIRQLALNDGIQIVDSPLWLYDGLVAALEGQIPVVVRLLTASRQIVSLNEDQNLEADLMGELERTLLVRATHLLPNTRSTLDTARQVYGLAPGGGNHTIVPYGIVPAPEDEVRPLDPAHLPETFTVLFVGRLEKRKGILDLFQAIPPVLARVPNARFIIAGSDNSENDRFLRRTGMSYTDYFTGSHPQLMDRVHFTGFVSEERLQALYRSCDLFVAPSIYESFGLIYLEAMNYAKPVIGCRSGGVPEVIDEGLTGLLVEPQNPTALAEAIVSLLQMPGRLREMGIAARERLLEEFTYVQMARRFARAYRKAIRSFQDSHLAVQ